MQRVRLAGCVIAGILIAAGSGCSSNTSSPNAISATSAGINQVVSVQGVLCLKPANGVSKASLHVINTGSKQQGKIGLTADGKPLPESKRGIDGMSSAGKYGSVDFRQVPVSIKPDGTRIEVKIGDQVVAKGTVLYQTDTGNCNWSPAE